MTTKLPLALDDVAERRAVQLDALSSILPIDRRDQLAVPLTDDEIATLKHLAEKGMGENTLRALTSDLGYLEAWARAATAMPSGLTASPMARSKLWYDSASSPSATPTATTLPAW